MIVAAPIPTPLFWTLVALLLALIAVCVAGIVFEVFVLAVGWCRWRRGL